MSVRPVAEAQDFDTYLQRSNPPLLPPASMRAEAYRVMRGVEALKALALRVMLNVSSVRRPAVEA